MMLNKTIVKREKIQPEGCIFFIVFIGEEW